MVRNGISFRVFVLMMMILGNPECFFVLCKMPTMKFVKPTWELLVTDARYAQDYIAELCIMMQKIQTSPGSRRLLHASGR